MPEVWEGHEVITGRRGTGRRWGVLAKVDGNPERPQTSRSGGGAARPAPSTQGPSCRAGPLRPGFWRGSVRGRSKERKSSRSRPCSHVGCPKLPERFVIMLLLNALRTITPLIIRPHNHGHSRQTVLPGFPPQVGGSPALSVIWSQLPVTPTLPARGRALSPLCWEFAGVDGLRSRSPRAFPHVAIRVSRPGRT